MNQGNMRDGRRRRCLAADQSVSVSGLSVARDAAQQKRQLVTAAQRKALSRRASGEMAEMDRKADTSSAAFVVQRTSRRAAGREGISAQLASSHCLSVFSSTLIICSMTAFACLSRTK